MGAALVFIFKSSLVMLAMYLVYKLLIARENSPAWNRGVLLSFYIAAPLIAALTYARPEAATAGTAAPEGLSAAELIESMLTAGTPAAQGEMPLWGSIAIWVWIAGMAFVLGTTAWSLVRIHGIVRRSSCKRCHGYRLCISPDSGLAPFSAWRTIVISADDYSSDGDLILEHEQRHIALGHRFDLLLARAAIVAAWFNPAAWLMAEELKAVHEYQADAAVLRAGVDARLYQMLLIKKAVGRSFPAIANSLNHSNLKKRITMMLKSKSASGRRWRLVAVAPAIVGALLLADMPAVASAMNTVSAASAIPVTAGKVTNISVNGETKTAPIAKKDAKRESLEDMVVVGYGPARRDSAAIDSKSTSLQIRGNKVVNITDENKPAVYIDDVLYEGSLADIDPNKIASITVLKDRDPNGEIFIKMKKDGEENVSHLAQFKGGEQEMYKYLAYNVKYPKFEKGTDVPETARVVVQFTITDQGKIINPQVVRGTLPEFDKEAIRVVREMPDFEPAVDNGIPIETVYTLPIVFRTVGDDKE